MLSIPYMLSALSGSWGSLQSLADQIRRNIEIVQDSPGAQDESPVSEPAPAPTEPGAAEPDRPGPSLPESPDAEPPQTSPAAETAQADRVTWLELSVPAESEAVSVRILEQPDQGQVSVTPDLKLALVMTGADQGAESVGFRYEVTLADGSAVEVDAAVDLTPGQQAAGWGLGENYMLETGSDGRLVLEHGDEHRKVHVTAGQHGLTAEDIAKAESLSVAAMEGKWGQWLKDHPEYGATEDKALNTELGMTLWKELSLDGDRTSSNWLLFERGYEYDAVHADRLVHRGSAGESELHPLVVTAYGEGNDPVIGGGLNIYQEMSANVVLHGIDLAGGAMALLGQNVLLDEVSIGGKGGNLQNVDGLTLRNSDIVDIVHDQPVNDGPTWQQHLNRAQGAYISNSTGILIEGNLFDHNGWVDGYSYDLSSSSPMPPSMYSQNLYIQANNLDVTVRDNIFLRGASFGAQVRSGGFIEDNAFIDNNAAVSFLGGNYDGAGPVGNYTLFLDNFITSAGHKRVAEQEGALSVGLDDGGRQSALIGNIITHMADPENPAEIAAKTVQHGAYYSSKAIEWRLYDDTIVWDWATTDTGRLKNPDQNVEGRDPVRMDETTIQNFTADLLDKPDATIADLADYLRAQAGGQFDGKVDADLINAFFREGFGLDTTLRADADTLVFIPDARGDGVRWDNRLNWSSGDLPGTQDGDSVDLAGNAVRFGSTTVSLQDLDFGDFGELSASSGKLTVAGTIAVGERGGALSVDRAGQVWIEGYRDSDLLSIDLAGGRFANTGAVAGNVDLHVSDNAQALLATAGGSFDLVAGSRLALEGSRVAAGFDGQDGGAAVLRLHEGAALDFVADEAGLATLGEFRSGAFGPAPQLASAISLGGTLTVDLSAWTPAGSAATATLVKADQIVGSFEDVEILGLAPDQDATVAIDYLADEILLVLDGNGSGDVTVTTTGADQAGDWADDPAFLDLWQALQAQMVVSGDNPLGG